MAGDLLAQLYVRDGLVTLAMNAWLGSRVGQAVSAAVQGPAYQALWKVSRVQVPSPTPAPSPIVFPSPRFYEFSATVYPLG